MKIEAAGTRETIPSLLWIIIAIAAILRLWGITGFSLSNDELSALARLQFNTAREVITEGVYPDFHPAGVQLFLFYWTKIFGYSEFVVRLPFALMGVGSVYLIYRVGRMWFGLPAGLMAAAALAVLQFPLLYSQIARPYSPGLFFSLMATFFWTKSLFSKQEKSSSNFTHWISFAGFALSVTACMYIHYFSFIFAGLLCIAGLFFLKRNLIIPYLLSGVVIILLYFPHLKLFLYQLSKGGVGGADGWLGPPGEDAFQKYLDYSFNDSPQLKLMFFIITSGTILLFRKEIKLSKFHLLSILFFSIPFLIAYYYSIYKNPVFQHSVMLFSFPYLLLILFSFIPGDRMNLTVRFLVFCILTGGIYSTVKEKNYYNTAHFSEFRGIAKRIKELDDKVGPGNITKTISVFSPYYISYYLDRAGHIGEFAMTSVMTEEERKKFRHVVEESKTPYFLHAYSNVYDDPKFDLIIRSQYPWVLLRDSMLSSGLRFYSREQKDTALNRLPLYDLQDDFESGLWENEFAFRDSILKYKGNYSVHITPAIEYGPGYVKKTSDLGAAPGAVVEISIACFSTKLIKNAKLVFSIDQDGKTQVWEAASLGEFQDTIGTWSRVFQSITIPEGITGDQKINIYCWNEKKEEVWLDDFKLKIYSPR